MYRIELWPGEETALRTIEELVVGIRNGVITSRARIWHNAGQKWLPIEFHPHYRMALQQLEERPTEELEPVAAVASPKAVPIPLPTPVADERAVDVATPEIEPDRSVAAPSPRHRGTGRTMGLLAAGCLVIAAAKFATSRMPMDTARVDTPAAATAPARSTADSRQIHARQASTLGATTMTSAAAKPVTPRKTIAGGGVVRGPTQVSPPTPPPSQPVATDDTIPSAPAISPSDLAPPTVERPALDPFNPDSIAR